MGPAAQLWLSAGQVTGTATAVERTGFVDAGRIGLSGDERIEVKLELGGGVVLHVVRDINSHREMPNQPVELVPLDSVYLDGPPHGFNMLAVPDAARVQGSAFRIVEGVSPKLLPHKDPHLHHPVGGF